MRVGGKDKASFHITIIHFPPTLFLTIFVSVARNARRMVGEHSRTFCQMESELMKKFDYKVSAANIVGFPAALIIIRYSFIFSAVCKCFSHEILQPRHEAGRAVRVSAAGTPIMYVHPAIGIHSGEDTRRPSPARHPPNKGPP